jgi:hypothetical protein
MESGAIAIAALIVAALAAPAAAQRANDGDTIDMNGTRWRLWGIDAPESRQTCRDGWPAGVEARHELEQLMAREPVQCEKRGPLQAHYRPMQGGRAGSRRGYGERRHGMGVHAVQFRLHWLGEGGDRCWARGARSRLHEGLGLACARQVAFRMQLRR